MKSDLLELPFVRRVPSSMDLWSVEETGDASQDNQRGRHYAIKLIARAQRENDPTLIPAVLSAVIRKARYGAVETGFMFVLSQQIVNRYWLAGDPEPVFQKEEIA